MSLGVPGGRGRGAETEGPPRPSDPPVCRPEEAGAEVPLLPRATLHVLAEQLDAGDLEQALLLLKLFIVLCRWVPLVLSKVGGRLGTAGRRRGWHIPGTSLPIPSQEPGERRGRLGPGAGTPGAGFADPVDSRGEVGSTLGGEGGGVRR